MKKHIIGISCIGTGVGQSIINSINLSKEQFYTIGLGTNPFAYGAYDCDEYDYTLSIFDDNYVHNLIEICKKHKIEIILPGLDDEVLIFAKNKQLFIQNGIIPLCADQKMIELCRNKEKMSDELSLVSGLFSKSYNKSNFLEAIQNGELTYPFISKPIAGFGSRGVQIINSKEDHGLIGEDHFLQEFYMPEESDPNYSLFKNQLALNINPQLAEISVQFVYGLKGELLGKMMSYNKLKDGVPIEIIPYENPEIWSQIDQILPYFLELGLVGPLNIQGRMTKNGFKIFEMNPRFTGITGLRALMGFNEVVACINYWLNITGKNNKITCNYDRFGIRQIADKSLSLNRNVQVREISKQLNKLSIKSTKSILLTGATGYLGRHIVNKIMQSSKAEKYDLITLGLDPQKAELLFKNDKIKHFSYDDIENGKLNLGTVDVLVHSGFARPYKNPKEIAESLRLSGTLFSKAVKNHIPFIINISSQSVYGSIPPIWDESLSVAPETPYAQAKLATELTLQNLSIINNDLRHTSLRLTNLAGNIDGYFEMGVLSKMIRSAIQNEKLDLFDGNQTMEYLSVEDAAEAILKLIDSEENKLSPIYNLGSNEIINLKDIAQIVNKIFLEQGNKDGFKFDIILTEKPMQSFGMCSNKFMSQLEWKPQRTINHIIGQMSAAMLNTEL